jgi:hypothetical protein
MLRVKLGRGNRKGIEARATQRPVLAAPVVDVTPEVTDA